MSDFVLGLAWYIKIALFFIVIFVSIFLWSKYYYREEIQIQVITKQLKKNFDFLFKKGFSITKVTYSAKHFGNWYAELRLSNYLFSIVQDRGEIQIQVAPQIAFREKTFNLEHLIDYLEGKNPFSRIPRERASTNKQLQYFNSILNSHYDEIISFFENKDFIVREQEYKNKYFSHRYQSNA